MIDTKQLWKQRYGQYMKEIRVYLRYMFNDHLLIALIFLLGGAAFTYNQWLEGLPRDFPYAMIIGVIITFVLTSGHIQTLLKEPDLVFLLPVEKKLTPYFKRAFIHSLLMQGYVLLIVSAALAPLYLKATGQTVLSFVLIFLILVLAKGWNLLMDWLAHHHIDRFTKIMDRTIRFLFNFVLTYFLFSGADLLLVIIVIFLMLALFFYYQKISSDKSLKWDQLIEIESKRMLTFYRIANLFTDVPKLKERVKRRRWLDWTLIFLRFDQSSTFTHLYVRTFLRTSDYLGMYLRLVIIGGLLLYFAPFEVGKIGVGVLFIYLTGYQLMTLWRQHNLKIWIQLYPVSVVDRTDSFLRVVFMLLAVQSVLLALFLLASNAFLLTVYMLLVGIVFSYFFTYFYVKSKLKKL
ncbi:ABC transporter permease [Bacillus timonensis]|nr:ABC transporter permease [Bacillus timonensis]